MNTQTKKIKTLPTTKEDYINLIQFYLTGKTETISTQKRYCDYLFTGETLYHFIHLPELYNYLHFYKINYYTMKYLKSHYTLPKLKNMLQSFEIDIEDEYKRYISGEVRVELPYITKDYDGNILEVISS
jgi:hypothetical protein